MLSLFSFSLFLLHVCVCVCPVDEQGKTLSSVALLAFVACDSSAELLTFVHVRLRRKSLAHTICNVTIVPQQWWKFHKEELVCSIMQGSCFPGCLP